MDSQQKNPITEGSIYKQLLIFFFPILMGTFFQQLYNTVDAIIIGKFVGKVALGAVGGATGTIINLLVGFFTGLSSGATVIISQQYGAKRSSGTSIAVHTSLALAIACGIFMSILGLSLGGTVLRAMDTPEDIYPLAVTYLNIYFGGILFSMIYNIGCGILRAVGDAKRPLYYLIICTLLNVVLDLLFVVVFDMSVAGVAIATVLAQAMSAVLVMRRLWRCRRYIPCHAEKNTFRYGQPEAYCHDRFSGRHSVSTVFDFKYYTSVNGKPFRHRHGCGMDSIRQNRWIVLDDHGRIWSFCFNIFRAKLWRRQDRPCQEVSRCRYSACDVQCCSCQRCRFTVRKVYSHAVCGRRECA